MTTTSTDEPLRELPRDPIRIRISRRYLQLIEVDELNYRAFHGLPSGLLPRIAKSLGASAKQVGGARQPVLIFLYSSNPDGCERIDTSSIHSFSIIDADPSGGALFHQYYEFDEEGRNAILVDGLSCELGLPSHDVIRMLHFAAAGSFELPARSTIYELRSSAFDNVSAEGTHGRDLQVLLAQDQSRFWGLKTVGLRGNAVYEVLLDNNPGGGIEGCSETEGDGCDSGSGECVTSPVAGYVCKSERGNGGTGDGCVSVAEALRASRLPTLAAVDFKTFKLVFDSILRRTAKGLDFVTAYYVIGPYLRTDLRSLRLYIRTLPHLNRAMKVLLTGSDDEIVVTQQLSSCLRTFFQVHREIEEPAVRRVATRLEADLASYVGRPRGDIIADFGLSHDHA